MDNLRLATRNMAKRWHIKPNTMIRNKILIIFIVLIHSINLFCQNDYEINTVLMNTTFMIEGKNGSFGTAFILGVPTKKDKTQLYPILITAKHVLDSIKGDTAYLNYRKLFNNQLYLEKLKLLIRQKGKNIYKSIEYFSINLNQNVRYSLITYKYLE